MARILIHARPSAEGMVEALKLTALRQWSGEVIFSPELDDLLSAVNPAKRQVVFTHNHNVRPEEVAARVKMASQSVRVYLISMVAVAAKEPIDGVVVNMAWDGQPMQFHDAMMFAVAKALSD